MKFPVSGAPFQPPATSVGGVMRQVLYALVPAVAAHIWFFGYGILFQIALAVGFAVGFEAIMLKLRDRPVRLFLSDYSAVVTGVLFALCLPPLAPWWIAAIGMLFAVVIAKHLYGGLGYNLFNPAMVGFAAVIVAFPMELSQWLLPRSLSPGLPGLIETGRAVLTGSLPAGLDIDAVTGATPLDTLRTGVRESLLVTEIRQAPIFGDFGGRGWEWIANFYALGGLYLVWKRVISWHVPVALIATTIIVSMPLWLLGPDIHPSPAQHIFSGALVLAAFFIATDPVSGCSTPRGKLVFGAGVAILTLAIRRWGGYPDGVAFAVLLMNMAAPLVDRLTRPRTYGH
ncbi:RnfABCDGE type electron transport complex subunit D [Wenzhouxiangella sp. EGI_FJ10409]|uniref:RnfABCDGE type electron transport complex subunit D n=1 Tax=Wenzhouxiangella sp. EGI_FJ10409 TaxID=3243767 RepID=UPI0035D550E1